MVRDRWNRHCGGCIYLFRSGNSDHHRDIDAGFNQIRQCTGRCDRPIDNYLCFSALLASNHSDHADINLHGNTSGNRCVQFGGDLGSDRRHD